MPVYSIHIRKPKQKRSSNTKAGETRGAKDTTKELKGIVKHYESKWGKRKRRKAAKRKAVKK